MTSCARADNHARRASLSCNKETARTQSLGRARFVLFQSNETDWTPVWTTWQDASCTTMSLHGMLDGAFPFKLSQGQTRSAVEIDKHIHTYFPVVSQHLGVPKYMRGKLVGDKVGLDAFFLEEEALISKCKLLWRRSLDVSYSILPGILPAAYLRWEGAIRVTVKPFDYLLLGNASRMSKATNY